MTTIQDTNRDMVLGRVLALLDDARLALPDTCERPQDVDPLLDVLGPITNAAAMIADWGVWPEPDRPDGRLGLRDSIAAAVGLAERHLDTVPPALWVALADIETALRRYPY